MSQLQSALSDDLRQQYDDIKELYDTAKLNENAGGMEKLSKILAGMVKQIKEQELHELETLKRTEVHRLVGLICIAMSKAIKEHIDDDDLAAIIIATIRHDVMSMAEDKTL